MQLIFTRCGILSVILVCGLLIFSVKAEAKLQANPSPATPANQDQEVEITPPEDVSFTTKDGVQIVATYFAGPKSKDTPPVILIHDWTGERKKMFAFAQYLQKELQSSVIVPDLRGHGNSLKTRNSDKDLNLTRFNKAEVASAVVDIESCKKFLMARNNQGELNIELLSIISVGETAVHAVEWAIADWSWGLAPGGLKQGQDVKMIVMISPAEKVAGISMKQNLKVPLMNGNGMQPLPLQIVWANDNASSVSEAKEIYDSISKSREKSTDSALAMTKIETKESPTGMVSDPALRNEVFQKVAAQIRAKILDNRELLAWQNRNPK